SYYQRVQHVEESPVLQTRRHDCVAFILIAKRATARGFALSSRSRSVLDHQMILNPICICLGSRVRPAWPKLAGIVALVIVVALVGSALFSVTAVGFIVSLKAVPPYPLRKFARLSRLKMSQRNWSLMPLASVKFL